MKNSVMGTMIHLSLMKHQNYLFSQKRKDRGTKMLNYIGNVSINGFPGIEKRKRPVFDKPRIPIVQLIWN